MTIKHKFKPAARADIRERVELKFRARGAVAFHLLLLLAVTIWLLYNLPESWAARFVHTAYQDSVLALVVLAMTGALHYIRYHFRHGKGRDEHERETEARIRRQLQRAAPEDAGEQEVLIRLQQDDKLKNRRLVWQHLTVFVGVISLLFLLPLSDRTLGEFLDWSNLQSYATFAGVWGIGLAAHVLRYVFAYRVSSGRREAKIEQQLIRELRREKRQRQSAAQTASEDSRGLAAARAGSEEEISIEDLLRGQSPAQRAGRQ
ncbi:MAG: 2TM domain-containing protein [Chloroflexi bacterium]|nr:2TM domain-containing protein [Chloroflexota bacterium]